MRKFLSLLLTMAVFIFLFNLSSTIIKLLMISFFQLVRVFAKGLISATVLLLKSIMIFSSCFFAVS